MKDLGGENIALEKGDIPFCDKNSTTNMFLIMVLK